METNNVKKCTARRVQTTALVGYVNQLVIQLTGTIYLVKEKAKSVPFPEFMEKHSQTSQSCQNVFVGRAKDVYAIFRRTGTLLFKRSYPDQAQYV